jgi:hypothetical protein
MGLIQKLFGGGAAPASQPPQSRTDAPSRPGADGASVPPAAAMRRELLRLALRQTLTRNGIPTSWVAVQMLDVGSREGAPGVHIRLVLQHWEPRLLPYTLSFQHDMEQRLLAVEPQAESWLRGFSWQYEAGPGDPVPMPDPATWTASAPPADVPPVALEQPQAGPPRKSKEELAQLFAQQDRSRSRQDDDADFAPTQPVTW